MSVVPVRPGEKPNPVALLTNVTRTTSYRSDTLTAKTENGILVVLTVTAASGTGGLTVRINAQEQPIHAGTNPPWFTPLNNAPPAVTTTGNYTYVLYPFGAAGGGAVNQATAGFLPRDFSISVDHGDSSSYTYSLGYSLLLWP